MPRPTLAAAVLLSLAGAASAQPGRPTGRGLLPPLADTPTGLVAARGALLDASRRGFQTVNVSVNGGGAVEVFAGGPGAAAPVEPAPNGDTLFQLCVGRTYRLRVTDVPELTGETLFPSVELVDRLHPPLGLASAFPLPISVTRAEAELAAAGVLVTKVIYLEDPLTAPVTEYEGPLRRTDLPPTADALTDAGARGRVIAIVRLGGRTPEGGLIEPAFYGTGGPVLPAPPADPNLPAVPPVSAPLNVAPASHTAGVLDCPLGGGCPAGSCPTGACPPDGRPVKSPELPCPAPLAVPRVPYNRGVVLNTTPPAPYCPAEVYPRDEYLCDGGDRLRPAGVTLGGVDTEDAVVRYRASDGELEVLPTNRVCIYAPRFAEVRTFFGVVNDTLYRGTADLMRTAAATAAAIDVAPGLAKQDVRPDAAAARSRVSGLIGENPYSALSDVLRQQQNERITEPLRVRIYDQANLRTGLSGAELAERSDAARTWTRADNPVIFYKGQGTAVAVNTVQPQVIVGLEDHGRPGYLCVRKLADRVFAAPGDIVTFTITLENTGGEPLEDVTVLDNLTPRLAFVEGSAESDLPGRVEVTPNGEGSDIVRFVLTEPLEAGDRGSVTFQTRVR